MSDINEQVQVAMLFRAGEVRPAAFLWNGHRYEVSRVTLAHKTRLGDVLQWHFAVETKGGGVARLAFDTLSLAWQLEAIG
jgi:hypothetical protein